MKYVKEIYNQLIVIFILFDLIYTNAQINFNFYHKTLVPHLLIYRKLIKNQRKNRFLNVRIIL